MVIASLALCLVGASGAVALGALDLKRTSSPPGAQPPATAGEPASLAMKGLSLPRRHQDDLPAADTAIAQNLATGATHIDRGLRPGTLQFDRSRRLLSTASGDTVYAVPTSDGAVCYFADRAGAGCVASFDDLPSRIAWFAGDPDKLGAGEPASVGGIVPDDVVGIQVVVDGIPHDATLENNAFFYRLEDSAAWPGELDVTYADGRHDVVEIHAPGN